jgi:hypothetical protein
MQDNLLSWSIFFRSFPSLEVKTSKEVRNLLFSDEILQGTYSVGFDSRSNFVLIIRFLALGKMIVSVHIGLYSLPELQIVFANRPDRLICRKDFLAFFSLYIWSSLSSDCGYRCSSFGRRYTGHVIRKE